MQYYFPNYPDISLDNIIAVDFGTTNTAVFVVHNNKAEAIQIDGHLSILRSVVSYGNNGVLVGNAADKNRNFTLKAYNIKRIAGLTYEEGVSFDRETFGCDMVNMFGQLAVKGVSRGVEVIKTVEEVITDIFKYIKHTVEGKYGTEFNYLVLTVPSTYRSTQKKTIRSAAIKAGFDVASMLSEPTAAGIHYRYVDFVSSSSIFLVFDFGGGTLDLSLVSCIGNKFEVLANGGNPHLGGADVDNKIRGWIEECYIQDGNDHLHLNSREERALKQTIEQKKQELSEKEVTEIEVTEDVVYELSRAELADIISNITTEIMTCLDKLGAYVLDHYEGKRIGDHLVTDMDSPTDILPTIVSSVLLVGGSSKLLAVQEKLETVFDKSIIHMDCDSQMCVGMGAMESLMYIEHANQIHECLYNQFVILVNKCEVGKIPRGTTIPFDVSYTLGRRKRGADVEVVVKQIMEEERREEVVLEFNNSFFPDVARLYLSIKVDIQYDGLLRVRVRDEMSGLEQEIGRVEYCSVCYKHQSIV